MPRTEIDLSLSNAIVRNFVNAQQRIQTEQQHVLAQEEFEERKRVNAAAAKRQGEVDKLAVDKFLLDQREAEFRIQDSLEEDRDYNVSQIESGFPPPPGYTPTERTYTEIEPGLTKTIQGFTPPMDPQGEPEGLPFHAETPESIATAKAFEKTKEMLFSRNATLSLERQRRQDELEFSLAHPRTEAELRIAAAGGDEAAARVLQVWAEDDMTPNRLNDIEIGMAMVPHLLDGTMPPPPPNSAYRNVRTSIAIKGALEQDWDMTRALREYAIAQSITARMSGDDHAQLLQVMSNFEGTINEFQIAWDRWKALVTPSELQLVNKAMLQTSIIFGGPKAVAAIELQLAVVELREDITAVLARQYAPTQVTFRAGLKFIDESWTADTIERMLTRFGDDLYTRINALFQVTVPGLEGIYLDDETRGMIRDVSERFPIIYGLNEQYDADSAAREIDIFNVVTPEN